MPFGRRKVELTPSQDRELAEKEFTLMCGPAVYRCSVRKIKKVLDRGVDPNMIVAKHSGETALHFLTLFGRADAVKALLDRGADVNHLDNYGNTPLHNAHNKPEMVRLLLERGANPEIKNGLGKLAHEEFGKEALAEYYRVTNVKLKRLVD